MSNELFVKLLAVVESDRKYALGAYEFVFEGLEHTLRSIGERRHISGQELCAGLRRLALQRFGMLGKMVFRQWGVTRTADFGEIVFRLVEAGLMGKTEADSLADFQDGFDFEEVFTRGALEMPLYARPSVEAGSRREG